MSLDNDYDQIDRFLRNNLGDLDYKEYSAALERLVARPASKPVAWGMPCADGSEIIDATTCIDAEYTIPLYAGETK